MSSRSIVKFLVLLLSAFLLSACGPVYQTTYTYKPPRSFRGRRCINRCANNRSFCQMQCQSNNQQCHAEARRLAWPQYRAYVRRQRRLNKPVVRTVDYYADYSMCQDNCGCTATYRQCYSNCGGQVIAVRQCVMFCKKAQP